MKKPIDILVFGGSFDPIHEGHIHMLNVARSALQPSLTVVVPNYLSPLKQTTLFSEQQRLTMVQTAIQDAFGMDGVEVSDIEIIKPEKSYTVDTLSELQKQYPGKQLGFLCGSDSAVTFHNWVEPERILSLARCVVMPREHHSEQEIKTYFKEMFNTDNIEFLTATLHPASSTQIRSEITGKNDVLNHVPRGIEPLIKEYCHGDRNHR